MRRELAFCLIAVLALTSSAMAFVPQLINFQGILKDGSGNPVADGSYSVTFRIYDAPAGGTLLWTETQPVSTVSGLFAVLLGSTSPVPDTAFNGSNRYLGVAVSPDPEMTPRQRLVSVAYSYRVNTVDSASGGTITSKVSIGPGHTNTGTDAFVAGASNTVSGYRASVGGGTLNVATNSYTAVGGGSNNAANGQIATVDGGYADTADGDYSTVGGGSSNKATYQYATVSGGSNNEAFGWSTVGGGENNLAGSVGATIGGGTDNYTGGSMATVGGGQHNIASTYQVTISGGKDNLAYGPYATISGGENNLAADTAATISGGRNNQARGPYSVVSGGGGANPADSNSALGGYSAVGGGRGNNATGHSSVVGGGGFNSATNINATVGGGANDTASGTYATIPGGIENVASGSSSFAAGARAKARHDGTFVWSEGTTFASTAPNQFLINAPGGVGIGTTTPTAKLDVNGSVAIGSGTPIMKVLSASASLDFPNTASLTSSDLTLTVTGAAVGDMVATGIPAGVVSAGSIYTAWVSSANTVTFRFNNLSAGAVNPGAATFRAAIMQF